MKGFRAWLGASPLRLFLFYAIGWGVTTWLLSFVDGQGETTGYTIGVRACTAVAFAGVMTALTTRRLRRSGGVALVSEISDALDRGEAPSDADPSVWLPHLRRQRVGLQRSRWLIPVCGAAFASLGVWLIFLGSPLAGIIVVLLFVAFAVVNELQARWRIRELDDLIAELTRRE